MFVIFAKLYAGEGLPKQERAGCRMLAPLRALARAAWAVACLCGRALRACGCPLPMIDRLTGIMLAVFQALEHPQ